MTATLTNGDGKPQEIAFVVSKTMLTIVLAFSTIAFGAGVAAVAGWASSVSSELKGVSTAIAVNTNKLETAAGVQKSLTAHLHDDKLHMALRSDILTQIGQYDARLKVMEQIVKMMNEDRFRSSDGIKLETRIIGELDKLKNRVLYLETRKAE